MSSYSSLDQHQGPGNKFLQILPPRFREPKKLKAEFDRWTSQQPIPLEALISGLAGTVQVRVEYLFEIKLQHCVECSHVESKNSDHFSAKRSVICKGKMLDIFKEL
jgi:hypothetical protein